MDGRRDDMPTSVMSAQETSAREHGLRPTSLGCCVEHLVVISSSAAMNMIDKTYLRTAWRACGEFGAIAPMNDRIADEVPQLVSKTRSLRRS